MKKRDFGFVGPTAKGRTTSIGSGPNGAWGGRGKVVVAVEGRVEAGWADLGV